MRTIDGQRCGHRYDSHGLNRECPSVDGTFLPYSQGTTASNSFTRDEVLLLDALLTHSRRSADLSVLARRPAMASLSRKVLAMAAKIEAAAKLDRAITVHAGTSDP